tara:strand:- start:322 stop:690 length:369 start_codon:yes stop_codon:yes gene_type:complete
MKKALILFGIITLFLNSCGSKAANLDVNDLEDPCDFVEAYIDNLEAQIKLLEKNEGLDEYEWKKKDKKNFKKLKRLNKKIGKQQQEIIEDDYDEDYQDFYDELEDCDDFDDIEDLQDDLRSF